MRKRTYTLYAALLALCVTAVLQLWRNAPVPHEATAAYHAYEQAVANLSASTDRVQHSQRQARIATRTAGRVLTHADSQAQRSAAALADTATTANQLREELSAQLRVNDSLRLAVVLLTASVDSLSAATSSQQAALTVAIASADSAVAAYRRLAEASAQPCRILRLVPCPTRGQAAIIGLATGIAILR